MSLLDEINDEMREQKLKAFWAENARFIIGMIVLAIVATAVLSFYRGYSYQQNKQKTGEAMALVRAGKMDEIARLAKEKPSTQMGLASFVAAEDLVKKGESDKALALYDAVAKMRGAEPFVRDAAILAASSLRMAGDEAAKETAESALVGLSKGRSPWRFQAQMNLALLHHEKGESEKARALLTALGADKEAPMMFQEEAKALLRGL
jgi:hypothetical protein